jgi:hypothetical protein
LTAAQITTPYSSAFTAAHLAAPLQQRILQRLYSKTQYSSAKHSTEPLQEHNTAQRLDSN